MITSHSVALVSMFNSSNTSGWAIISNVELPMVSLTIVISAGVERRKLVAEPKGLKYSCLGPSSLLHLFPHDVKVKDTINTDQSIFLITTIANIVDETTSSR